MNGQTLIEALGGEAAIEKVVKSFYDKILRDEELYEFFKEIKIEEKNCLQKYFLISILGGPDVYNGKDMIKAHENLKLEDVHFELIKKHLINSLNDVIVDHSLIPCVMERIEPLRKEVLNK
jgi:hemoglobin